MKRRKEFIIVLISLLVIVLSVSAAYFTIKVLGTGKEISVDFAELKVTFTSGSGEINGSNIKPGWTSGENTFTVKNESNGTYEYNIIIKDLINTLVTTGFLQYKITSTDGGYNMTDFVDVPKSSTATDTVLAYNISIAKETTHTYKVVFNYNDSNTVDQTADMGKKIDGTIFITKGLPKLADQLLTDNPNINTRTSFNSVFTTNTAKTLYKGVENNKDIYYYAGKDTTSTPVNNWVKFGKYITNSSIIRGYYSSTNNDYVEYSSMEKCKSATRYNYNCSYAWKSGDPIYWRIIRTNADGSIRLLYSGTNPNTTEGYIGKSAFNTTYNSPKYAGYMYGNSDTTLEEARTNTNDSTIKTYIDDWYENNLLSYTNYLSSDAIYCNDREIASGDEYKLAKIIDNKSNSLLAYVDTRKKNSLISASPGKVTGTLFNFSSNTRLQGSNPAPTFDCTNNKDAFSVNNEEAKLKYPIALMTADEIAYAGGSSGNFNTTWVATNKAFSDITNNIHWWTLSPIYYTGSPQMWVDDTLAENYAGHDAYVVRPVVSLKACVSVKAGNASANSPYEILENGGC